MACLFIDMDGTLIAENPARDEELVFQRRLMGLLRDLAVERQVCTAEAAVGIIHQVEVERPYWRWADFLRPLQLDGLDFWAIADSRMRPHHRVLHPNLAKGFQSLRDAGHRLWIASNNPGDGVRHKLRLAGVPDRLQDQLLDGVVGTDTALGCKSAPGAWERTLAAADCSPEEALVVGDNPCEDMALPYELGVRGGVLLSGHEEKLCFGWTRVPDFATAVRALTDPHGELADALAKSA